MPGASVSWANAIDDQSRIAGGMRDAAGPPQSEAHAYGGLQRRWQELDAQLRLLRAHREAHLERLLLPAGGTQVLAPAALPPAAPALW